MTFQLTSPFQPAGDQPKAIKSIVAALRREDPYHVLLGVTGSGKTYTMAHVIAELDRSALIIAPNKTLASQLYTELKDFFPKDPVGFFISYYDYYQPEAYMPSTDTYIAKDSAINDDIDKMRHEATMYLFEKKHAIIVASVSCIYGLGSPSSYGNMVVSIKKGQILERDAFLKSLIHIQYTRKDVHIERGCFRVRGEVVDLQPAYEADKALRVMFWGNKIDDITVIDALKGTQLSALEEVSIYPNSHYVAEQKNIRIIIEQVLRDLEERLRTLKALGKSVEYQRLEQRTMQDVELLEQLGFCPGIENYSRYLNGKQPGEPPPCLLDYFPKDFITIIDESHITLPQIGGMYRGDRGRKQTLVDYGFRLPSALDNRPLNFDEFLGRNHQVLLVSATPSAFDLQLAHGGVSEQIIRPTGLLDPKIEVKQAKDQVDDLYGEMRRTLQRNARILIITLTKKMAEDLAEHYNDMGLKVRYLHSDLDTLERSKHLRELRMGVFDVLIGINLLREGLDLPEVELVAVMDADKEGFLRSRTSLVQIVGRAARNEQARVIFYADKMTTAMQEAMEETARRRHIQQAHNHQYGITPTTVVKPIPEDLRVLHGFDCPSLTPLETQNRITNNDYDEWLHLTTVELEKKIRQQTKEMKHWAGCLEFEKAAQARNALSEMKKILEMRLSVVQGDLL